MLVLGINADVETGKTIGRICKTERLVLHRAYSGEEGIDFARSFAYNLLLVDQTLPDLSGDDVLERIRRSGSKTPALVVGAESMVPAALTERMQSVLYSARRTASSGRLTCNFVDRQVTLSGIPLHLSPKEYQVLRILMFHIGQEIDRGYIFEHVYHLGSDVDPRIIDTIVSRLRKRFAEAGDSEEYITTLVGRGYMVCK